MTELTLPRIAEETLAAVAEGRHHEPHAILGQHPLASGEVGDPVTVIRALRPLAESVSAVLASGARLALAHVGHGIWQGVSITGMTDYVIEARYADGSVYTADDPYRFSPTLGEADTWLIQQGRHEQLWNALGAHVREHWGVSAPVSGVAFAVWAPNATAVRVVGDFNGWDGTMHAMRSMGPSGVWELFVPGLGEGALYKYDLRTPEGDWVRKIDPLAQYTEVPPATASVVGVSRHEWADDEWMASRPDSHHDRPVSIYELHFGSWRPGLGYREAADQLIEYVTGLGFTHVEFLPLAEHPFSGSWGYQVTGYYAASSRFGHPDDLRYLIDRLHQAGIGVIMDWVPGHFPKDDWALARYDGRPLYEHADPRLGEQKDWGTYVFDFGRTEVRNFLYANALYWLEEFHVDGLRVDAVASMLYRDYSRADGEWIPNIHGGREYLEAIAFLQETTATAYKRNPGIMMIAEESTSWNGVTAPTSRGGLGFGFKWNMGWMHDSLQYIERDPAYRAYHHNEMTFAMVYAYSENFILPISHDEVVHGKGSLIGKMPGDHWQKRANVRAFLAFMWAHPGKQLLFMGQEFGQYAEWNADASLDWHLMDSPEHAQLAALVGELNRVYRDNPALWRHDTEPRGFEWIAGGDAQHNVIAFLRWAEDGPVAVVANFAGHPHYDYRIGLPQAGDWDEIVNTDAADFGGSGVGNLGRVRAEDRPWGGRPASASLTLPPLGVVYLRPAAAEPT
ncbi:1,4-alpha-glucan branching protein GlgB [Gryllotalpicola ginsengisoli]|uniref:1,4-alpha-glucan branching protein GlgB n=1 Tax=Gryllotalpicola ginsengisoli TaxID=444608 RepID=UPI0003B4C995|nr:1,4-alpha-glucan branching protein GlgB [Gryllotalpicola ginsengisoli]